MGTDESFFEDDRNDQIVRDLFPEKAGILDGDADTEVDLSSFAHQIWKNATDARPELLKIILDLPNVVYSTKATGPGRLSPRRSRLRPHGPGTTPAGWTGPETRSPNRSSPFCEPRV